jgi:ankyrin repeat protein
MPVDLENNSGLTALNYAVHGARAAIVTILGQNGADINHANPKTKETPLMTACYRGDNEVVTRLLRFKPDLDAQDVNGVTAAMRAAGQNNKECLKFVMEAGADPFLTSKTGRRVVDFAATAKAQECIDYLCAFLPQYTALAATEGTPKAFAPMKKITFRRMEGP